MSDEPLDLLVVGAGPTGIAIGAEARRHGLKVLLLDRGALTHAILNFPEFMTFFTTRDKLEIAGIPFAIPDDKPTRQQALTYYRAVASTFGIPFSLHENVIKVKRELDRLVVFSEHDGRPVERTAHAVALATGYFFQPNKLSIFGTGAPWVQSYFREPYRHFGESVVLIGGGNTACEVALELYRNGVQSVTMVVRDRQLKDGVKYWVRPDVENRIAEGAIKVLFRSQATAFMEEPRRVMVQTQTSDGPVYSELNCDAAYVLIGFAPDAALLHRCGVQLDPETLIPQFDSETCESNVPGLYVCGTLQAGRDTGRIFIENSRDNGVKIVRHLLGKRSGRA